MQGKILIVGTNMMNIYHHRLELIKSLIKADYTVVVTAPTGEEVSKLKETGCKFRHMEVENRGTNIIKDLILFKNFRRICREEKPDVILTFYTKTNIYGGLVARSLKIPYIENITGLGSALSKGKGLIYRIMSFLYKHALKDVSIVYFQNKANYKFFIDRRLYKGEYKILPGSGVSFERYSELPYPADDTTEFVFISRILKEKGIDEYIYAATEIGKKRKDVKFHVVGPCHEDYLPKMQAAHESGTIQYHGKVYDLHDILSTTHCTVLPSYYPEGMANVLLESAASGRPLITTTLPGCGETVDNNVTGFTVREKDGGDLAEKMEKFLDLSHEEKKKMGDAGRQKMEREFNRDIVTREYLHEIREILKNKRTKKKIALN